MNFNLRTYAELGLVLALLAALVWGFSERTRAAGYKADVAVVAKQHAEAVTRSVTAALAVEQANRAEEGRRENAKQEAIDAAKQQTEVAQRELATARTERDRLRERVAAFAAAAKRAAANPAPGAGSPPATSALDVLADLFYRADSVSQELGEALDRSWIAGRACERQYDSLTSLKP